MIILALQQYQAKLKVILLKQHKLGTYLCLSINRYLTNINYYFNYN